MTDTIEEIRARHKADADMYRDRRHDSAHADRATLLRALDEALAGWQPIETAPKDGTQILACAQLSEHLTAAIISSQGHVPDLSIVKWDDREKDFIAMADGYMSIKSQGDNWTTYHEPYVTHWMPLPIPPATLKETGQ